MSDHKPVSADFMFSVSYQIRFRKQLFPIAAAWRPNKNFKAPIIDRFSLDLAANDLLSSVTKIDLENLTEIPILVLNKTNIIFGPVS